jgi:hypothetical protein
MSDAVLRVYEDSVVIVSNRTFWTGYQIVKVLTSLIVQGSKNLLPGKLLFSNDLLSSLGISARKSYGHYSVGNNPAEFTVALVV